MERGDIEFAWLQRGVLPAGVDEVGRGCLAGPVVAGCVVLDFQKLRALPDHEKSFIRDSKTLSAKKRRELCKLIEELSLAQGIASASVTEIESEGIVNATFLAMKRAIQKVMDTLTPGIFLVDGNQRIRDFSRPQECVIKGDSLCYSIAAASILAKVSRDQYMAQIAEEYPHWGFEKHVGYGTKDHLSSIDKFGISPLHRRNFAPIRHFVEGTPSHI